MASFTKGIWCLKQDTKLLYAKYDKIYVLDLEGIDNEDFIHYLFVISMVLLKAILLCANYTGSGTRFKFSMFKTIETVFRLFKKIKVIEQTIARI